MALHIAYVSIVNMFHCQYCIVSGYSKTRTMPKRHQVKIESLWEKTVADMTKMSSII